MNKREPIKSKIMQLMHYHKWYAGKDPTSPTGAMLKCNCPDLVDRLLDILESPGGKPAPTKPRRKKAKRRTKIPPVPRPEQKE